MNRLELNLTLKMKSKLETDEIGDKEFETSSEESEDVEEVSPLRLRISVN